MTKLPEPVDFGYRDEAGNWNIQFGYTEAQMLQFRRDVLEEAVLLCTQLHANDQTNILYAAKRIRKLKDET